MSALYKKKKRIGRILALIVVGLILIAYIFPLVWMGITSFKSKVQIFDPNPRLFFKPTLDNFKMFLGFSLTGVSESLSKAGKTLFIKAFGTSLLITASSTLFALILGTMAGYVLSRYEMKAKDDIMFFILTTRMLPPIVAIVPISLLFSNLGLKDTFLGFLLLYIKFNLAF